MANLNQLKCLGAPHSVVVLLFVRNTLLLFLLGPEPRLALDPSHVRITVIVILVVLS